MLKRAVIDEFARRIGERLPPSLQGLRAEIEDVLRAYAEPALQKMNLVAREEYDIQAAVLERLRLRLDVLEKRLEELEKARA